jgi:cytoskeleton protein RodZ
MNSPDTDASAVDKKRLTAGQALSERREKLGLSIEECAETLKLSITKMKALEADNDAPFPSDIFLRGYLKNYAKLVDLPASDIMYYFDSQRQTQASQDDSHRMDETNIKKRKLTGLPYLLAIAIIIAWFVLSNYSDIEGYWHAEPAFFQEQSAEVGGADLAEDTPKVSVDPSRSSPLNSEEIKNELITSESLGVDQSFTGGIENIVISVDESSNLDAPKIEQSLPDVKIEIDSPESSSDALEKQTSINFIDVEQTLLAGEVNNTDVDVFASQNLYDGSRSSVNSSLINDVLYFTFLEICWVEVVDATNKTIVSSIRKADTELLVEGRSPFSIVLGNINGTTLRFNDDAVTLVNSSDGRTLRLTVGG